MTRWTALLMVAAGVGCSGKDEDSGNAAGPGGGAPYMNILSPSGGQFIDEGDPVLLEVEGRDSAGTEVPISEVVWSAEEVSWSAQGNAITVTDLPAGLYDIAVSGLVIGVEVTDVVEVAVYAP